MSVDAVTRQEMYLQYLAGDTAITLPEPVTRIEKYWWDIAKRIESGIGTGGGITVDSALSETSTNPVQNKVVSKRFGELSEQIDAMSPTRNEIHVINAPFVDTGMYYDNTMTPFDYAYTGQVTVAVKKGETYYLSSYAYYAMVRYILVDDNNTVYDYAKESGEDYYTDTKIVVPDGATKLIIQARTVNKEEIVLKKEVLVKVPMGEQIEAEINKRNPLYGKTVLFDGDSICASTTDTENGKAWAGRIIEKNAMLGENYAQSGGTISDENYRTDGSAYHCISTNVDTMYADYPEADYIIFEGGTNDADLLGSIIGDNEAERLGSFTLGDFSGDYDLSTFCGGFENFCYKATNYWNGKKIGYVIPYKMAGPSGLSSGYTKEKSNRRAYFEVAIQICEKWGIPVLNLWDNCYMNPSNVACYDPELTAEENKASKMIYDGQHPATKGYEYIYPIVEAWMKTL